MLILFKIIVFFNDQITYFKSKAAKFCYKRLILITKTM